jgi:hypothetical protein
VPYNNTQENANVFLNWRRTVEGGIVEAVVGSRLGRCELSTLPFDGEGEENVKTDSAARNSE